MQKPSVRLIEVTASGGYGKTFLTAKALEQVRKGSELSALWVSFNQSYPFGMFGRWLLQQFGQAVDEKLPDEDLVLVMVESLSQQRGLLVMDNLETLLQADGHWQEPVYDLFFRRWLSHGQHSTIVFTSRERVPLPHEEQQERFCWLVLGGLSLQTGVALLKAKGIRGEEADLERFVALVDGHPLSLSLTAGWLLNPRQNVTPDVTYALQQDDLYRFEQIVGDHRGNPDASVGRILAASVARLPSTLQTLWQALSVYRLSFDLAAAQAMMATATLDDLWELARRSLLQEQPVETEVLTQAEKWRFKFSPLVQRFAQQQADSLTAAHIQAVAYYRSVAQPAPWHYLEEVTAYLEAFHHLCELKQYAQAYSEIASCDSFLDLQGYNQIRLEMYEQLVWAWQQKAWQIEQNEDVEVLLNSLLNLGNSRLSLAQYASAIEVYQVLLELARHVDTRFYEGAALGSLGLAYLYQGNYGQAINYSQQLLTIAQEIGDRASEGKALGNLGVAYLQQGNYGQAINYSQQLLTIAQEIGDRASEGKALGNLGLAYLYQGNYGQAIDYSQQQLTIAQAIGDRHSEAIAWFNLGAVQAKLKQPSQAIQFYTNARSLYQHMELEAEVQDCDQRIQQLSLRKRGWFRQLVSGLLRVLHWLWRRIRKIVC